VFDPLDFLAFTFRNRFYKFYFPGGEAFETVRMPGPVKSPKNYRFSASTVGTAYTVNVSACSPTASRISFIRVYSRKLRSRHSTVDSPVMMYRSPSNYKCTIPHTRMRCLQAHAITFTAATYVPGSKMTRANVCSTEYSITFVPCEFNFGTISNGPRLTIFTHCR
jgi:hypothetical protein